MEFIVTLIGAADREATRTALARILDVLPCSTSQPLTLDENRAFDIIFQGSGATRTSDLQQQWAPLLAPYHVDIIIQAANKDRRKKLLIADMDSTMIGQECIDELADFAGVKQQVSTITEQAMRGEIAFEPALRQRVGLLKGLPVTIIDQVISERITPTPGAKTLIATMRKHGAYTALISGGFTAFTKKIAAKLGFDEQDANDLEQRGGYFTGKVREPILGREAKYRALHRLSAQQGLSVAQSLAVGDGANDLDMLCAAGLGIAYHAKPRVAEAASAAINFNDLTALLYAQGYRREEFVYADS